MLFYALYNFGAPLKLHKVRTKHDEAVNVCLFSSVILKTAERTEPVNRRFALTISPPLANYAPSPASEVLKTKVPGLFSRGTDTDSSCIHY